DADERVRDLAVVTVNGTPELAVLDSHDHAVEFYVCQADGCFQRVAGPVVPAGLPVRIIAGDVSGDGRQDLVVAAGGNPGSVFVYVQRPDGTFGPPDYAVPVGSSPSDLALVNLRGNGLPDIVVTDKFCGGLRVLVNSGPAPFSSQLRFRASTGPYEFD